VVEVVVGDNPTGGTGGTGGGGTGGFNPSTEATSGTTNRLVVEEEVQQVLHMVVLDLVELAVQE
jgi:hypothetical protein